MMKKFLYGIALLMVGLLVYSCVDDYQDANPPRLLDAPAVWSVTAASDVINAGASVQFTIQVTDCPAGIDSVAAYVVNADGDELGGTVTFDNLDQMRGSTKGDLLATYVSEANVGAVATAEFVVYDKQFDEEGEVVRKSSVPKDAEVSIVCPSDLAGTFDTHTTGVAGGGIGDISPYWDGIGVATLSETAVIGVYDISDMSGQFYELFWGGSAEPSTFRDQCGMLSIDTKTDQYGDTLSATVTDNGDGTYTIMWANTYGDSGTTVLTPQ